jgi:hypothetical protein
MLPVYGWLLLSGGGWKHLLDPYVMAGTLAGGLVLAAAFLATVAFAPFNVAVATRVVMHGSGLSSWRSVLGPIAHDQLQPALGILAGVGVAAAVVRRDSRMVLPVIWVASILAGVFLLTGPFESARYSILAVPAYCIMASTLGGTHARSAMSSVAGVILAGSVAWNAWSSASIRPSRIDAYEKAAEFVAASPSASSRQTVLYSAAVDGGYFVFFVRKHDPGRRLVVLRADKLLTTSLMEKPSVEDRIQDPLEIYPLLARFGITFIVIEDRPTGSRPLDWLRSELRSGRFVERRRFPLDDVEEVRLRGASLAIYEYRDARPADRDAVVDIKIPLVRREIRVPLSELHP